MPGGYSYTHEWINDVFILTLGDLNTAEAFLAIKSGPAGGGGHYATWQSAIHGFANAHELISIRKQLFPTPLPRSNHKMKRRWVIMRSYFQPFA